MADSEALGPAVLAEIADACVVAISHRPACRDAEEALCAAGLPAQAPDACSQIPVSGGYFARVSPSRSILVTRDRALSAQLMDALRTGLCDSAMAVDVSEGHAVLAWSGWASERLLAAATDAIDSTEAAVTAGTRRIADMKVILLRLDRPGYWLVVEVALADHLVEHLRHATGATAWLPGAVNYGFAPPNRAP